MPRREARRPAWKATSRTTCQGQPSRKMCQCGGGADHQHGAVAETPVVRSLHPYIDLETIKCLNAKKPTNVESVFRGTFQAPTSAWLESDTDAQIILKIAFQGLMKIKSISLHCCTDNSAPAELSVFINQPDLDFSSIEGKTPTQSWPLVSPASQSGTEPIEYPTKVFKFSNVSHLTLFIPRNFGAPTTKIGYIGIFGEFLLSKTNPIITKYELLPNPSDHKKEELMGTASSKQAF